MIAGLGVELDQLRDAAVARGGHLRVGLEDAPLDCSTSNAELVAQAARAVRAAGGELAAAAEIRRTTVDGGRPPSTHDDPGGTATTDRT